MISHTKYLVALLLVVIHACLGQPPMGGMFPGQAPMGSAPGMMSNPMFLPLAMSGMDFNKMMPMYMMSSGMGLGGPGIDPMRAMLRAYGLYHAFS